MKRQHSIKVLARNDGILQRIRELKEEHPFWGYRRIWATLRYVDKMQVNKKRVYRLMFQHELLVKPNMKLKAKRTPTKSKPKPTAPNQWWGIDMTKILINGFGWIYIVVVLDWYTKKILGYHVGVQARARHWLNALDMAVNQQFPAGVRGSQLHLMSDNGCQPTSLAFMKASHTLGVTQAFTSYNNPKGNADTERLIRTIKEECLWLREWSSPFELVEAFKSWVVRYNAEYLHSTLGYKSPQVFEIDFINGHQTQLVSA